MGKTRGNIHVIDALTWTAGYSSVYLLVDDRVVLVETGLSTSANTILSGVKGLGIRPEEVSHILITHLHMDHAGSAGILAREFPRAEVLIHPMGVAHLTDPTHLVQSSRKALGEFGKTWGLEQVVGVEQSRVKPAREGDVINLGHTALTVIETPGHAPHHICIHDQASNGLFVGDAVGMYFPQTDALSLTTPAPNFDLEVCIQSIERLKARNADVLYFSHFGPRKGVVQTLDRAIEKLRDWGEMVLRAAEQKRGFNYIAGLICEDMSRDAPFAPQWLHNQLASVFAAGYLKYYRIEL